MKYLFLLLMLTFSFVSMDAQKVWSFTGSDTVANTATVNLKLTVKEGYNLATFVVKNARLSGTNGGTSILQGSNDDTNWIAIDTVTHTNAATEVKAFEIVPRWPYYRIERTGSGTMSVITSATAHFKKY
jgi:hypothetical protein